MHLSNSFSFHIYLRIWPVGKKHHLRGVNKTNISWYKNGGNVIYSVNIVRRLDIRCSNRNMFSCLPCNGVDDNAVQIPCLCVLNQNSSLCAVQSGDFNFVMMCEEKSIFLRDEGSLHWYSLSWICIISRALVIITAIFMLHLFLHIFRYSEYRHRI